MHSIVKIDKITAAGCQIDTAIELALSDKDVVSAAVLTHSAWSIVKDLLIVKGIESSRSWMPEHFPNSTENEVWKKLDEVWMFCKHANKDPNAIIEFSSKYIEPALFLLLYDFSQISVKSKTMDVYELWFIATNENLYKTYDVFTSASEFFPSINTMSPAKQRMVGLKAILSIT